MKISSADNDLTTSSELQITTNNYSEDATPPEPAYDLMMFGAIISIAIIGVLIFFLVAFCLGCARCICKIGINDNNGYDEIRE